MTEYESQNTNQNSMLIYFRHNEEYGFHTHRYEQQTKHLEKFLSLHGLTLDTLNDAITKYKTDDLSIVKKYIKMYSIIHNYAEEDIKEKLRRIVEWACKTLKNHINQLEMLETHFENTIKNDKLIDKNTSSMMIKSQLERY
jgi:Na+/phosphate symporter